MNDEKRPHLIISNTSTSESFTSPPSRGPTRTIPQCDRRQQGQRLIQQITTVKEASIDIRRRQEEIGLETELGIRIQFEGIENSDMPFESLARESQGIEILNVKKDDHKISVTVYVPDGKLEHFEKLIHQYLEENTPSGKPKNLPLINTIDQIHSAAFDELWTDDNSVLPINDQEEIWWELWLPVKKDRLTVLNSFRQHAERLSLTVSENHLEFPERTIVSVRGNKQQLIRSVQLIENIAEIRRVKETAEFFGELTLAEQVEWSEEALDRITWPSSESPYICILDTGINNAHPLLNMVLDDNDLHTIEPAWSVSDIDGHGTGMSGLAVYGNLTDVLDSTHPIHLTHRLESVKILRRSGDNDGKNHGYLIQEAVSRAEITAPHRQRTICSAVTSKDNRDRGRPSAWSAAIDALASGANDDKSRLIVIAAGNMEPLHWSNYPDSNTTESIHDPGQAWNALTVGAYTQMIQIADDAGPDYHPLAHAGALSPHSTTSSIWDRKWPLKPDVVFEGGNIAVDSIGPVTMHSLSLLTTHYQPHNYLFDYFHATSAATALAAQFSATIQSEYPELWPETVRAIIIHSAEWTDVMRNQFFNGAINPTKTQYENMIRHCGFGVPDLNRALWSVSNSLTLIVQDNIQPFQKLNGKYQSKDMNLHSIPWPTESLLELGETEVQMRVSLSYFIEPNPSERGFSGRYRYASHGLRFDIKRGDETIDDFRARINRAARDEDHGTEFGGDGGGWLLGKQKRHLGSIHSDIWSGTATELASRHHITVYPTIGWWRERHHLKRYSKKVRYALVISIITPETELDLYNEIENVIQAPVIIEV